MSLTSLFLDMNAFFASCEQQLRQDLRGRPVIIVPVQAETTSCIAVSYEAKGYGIKTGTSVGEAKQRCRHVHIIEARPEHYIRIHHDIVAAVDTCLPIAAVCSIDEMYCRLMGSETQPARALELGRTIKHTIHDKVGPELRCSVGIAPNWLLSKIAAEMNKPDGLTVLEMHELPERLYCLDLADVPGIGAHMLKRLHGADVCTMRELCALSRERMRLIWNSVVGEELWELLRGKDLDLPTTHRRTVGHSHVLPPEFRTAHGSRAILVRLIHKAGTRLRYINYWARRIDVFVEYTNQRKWSDHASLGHCQDTASMLEAFEKLWEKRPQDGTPISVGMRLSGLTRDGSAPLPLFPDEQKRLRVSHAMDDAQSDHGNNAIFPGGMTEAAPKRAGSRTPLA